MSDPLTGDLDPFDVTVTASVIAERNDSSILRATLENGTDADGGEVEVRVTDSARCAYGLQACVTEFESYVNSTLRPEFRLGAALAMGEQGAFTIVTTYESGPRVLSSVAAMPFPDDLAA